MAKVNTNFFNLCTVHFYNVNIIFKQMQFYLTYKILNIKIYIKTHFYKITKRKKYSQDTTIFISYEWVDNSSLQLHVSASI
jgi:hypothetical protein